MCLSSQRELHRLSTHSLHSCLYGFYRRNASDNKKEIIFPFIQHNFHEMETMDVSNVLIWVCMRVNSPYVYFCGVIQKCWSFLSIWIVTIPITLLVVHKIPFSFLDLSTDHLVWHVYIHRLRYMHHNNIFIFSFLFYTRSM